MRTDAINLSQKEFEEAVVSALRTLPKILKKKMENMDVVVEDRASQSLMEEMELQCPYDLLGLYEGIPYDRRGFYYIDG